MLSVHRAKAAKTSRNLAKIVALAGLALSLVGCSASLISSTGPSAGRILRAPKASADGSGFQVVNVDNAVARRLMTSLPQSNFSATLGDSMPNGTVAGTGDVLEVVIWEAPPAVLFGAGGGVEAQSGASSISGNNRSTVLPEQVVGSDGRISVPFIGSVQAAGRTTKEISADITRKLSSKAHLPQVIVRISRNFSALATVVGDVTQSTRVPLTVKGERLLDAIAAAGGTRQPIDKMTVQITRGGVVESMPLSRVITDPSQNIVLRSGDIVTALYQPFSFTVLGATGRNDELPMETQGITLAQALGRIGGLQDQRADARGLFIFRFEDPAALGIPVDATTPRTPEGKIAVIYRVDMKNPASFFAAQSFPMRDKDVLYVSNAALADIQKFVSLISSTVFPIATVSTSVR